MRILSRGCCAPLLVSWFADSVALSSSVRDSIHQIPTPASLHCYIERSKTKQPNHPLKGDRS
jgi:hypothetical protein